MSAHDSGSEDEPDNPAPDVSCSQLALQMIANRIVPKTVKGCKNKLLRMSRWLESQYPQQAAQLIEADKLPKMPMNTDYTIDFFGELIKPRLQPHPIFGKPRAKTLEDGGHVSASTLCGFKSALVWLYAEHRIDVANELDLKINQLVQVFSTSSAMPVS
jgi:hypothetical protein